MTENQHLIKELRKRIKKHFGRECVDEDAFCSVCIAWRAFNTVKYALEIADWTEESKPKKAKKLGLKSLKKFVKPALKHWEEKMANKGRIA